MDHEADGDFSSGRYEYFNLGLTRVGQNAEVMPHFTKSVDAEWRRLGQITSTTPRTEHMVFSLVKALSRELIPLHRSFNNMQAYK